MNTNFIQYNSCFGEYAKKNRKYQTNAESIFWERVRNRKLLGYKFKRQKIVSSFILDFYCSELLLGVEIDGGYHEERFDYDIMRDSEIKHRGVVVVRFKNEEIENNLEGVLSELQEIMNQRKIKLME